MRAVVSSVAFCLVLGVVSCGSSEPPEKKDWKTDFSLFVDAVKAAIKAGKNLEAEFTGKEVTWTVTVLTVYKGPGKPVIHCKEAEPLHKEKPALDIPIDLRDDQAEKAGALKAGDPVTVKGKIGFVVTGYTPQYPDGKVMIGPYDAVIEDRAP